MSLEPQQIRERKAIRMLRTRARGMLGAKALIEGCGEHQERIEAALDEASAILQDAANECERPEVINGVA